MRKKSPRASELKYPPKNGVRVLVVDDEKVPRMVLESLLRRMGIVDVVMAEGGREALEVFAASEPDVVFTDVLMPNFDGIRLTAALRADAARSSVPIVAVTTEDEAAHDWPALGFSAFIHKPFTIDELKAVYEKVALDRA